MLFEIAREHEARAQLYEPMAEERRTFLSDEELREKADQERIQSERARVVAEGIRF